MKWRIEENKLVGAGGEIHELWPDEFWQVVPSRTSYLQGEKAVRPLDFAFQLHNASMGEGLADALDDLLVGIAPATMKRGAARDAEILLESIRAQEFPNLPSRLRCHFLSVDRETAERRASDMFRGDRSVVRCRLVLSSGRFHYADVSLYESLEGRPDDRALARKYWQTFNPTELGERQRLEVLADSALFFPDWRKFPRIEETTLIRWQADQPQLNN